MNDSNHSDAIKKASCELTALLGNKGWHTNLSDFQEQLVDSRRKYQGQCLGLALASSVEDVQSIVHIAKKYNLTITPQGGNTGRVGGATPLDHTSILLNLSRLNKIRTFDQHATTIIAEAGCILKDVQDFASSKGLFFPVSLGAESACHIGGNVATNAGGMNVLSFGNMRQQVMGVEVVLPNAHLWNGLNNLTKNNTGFDLKHLFIGSEGTLGIITAVTLKLQPMPKKKIDLFLSVTSINNALQCFATLRAIFGNSIFAFEFMHKICIETVTKHYKKWHPFFSNTPNWSLLVQINDTSTNSDNASTAIEKILEDLYNQDILSDAIIAQNNTQAKAFWHLREMIVEAEKREPYVIKHDIALPLDKITDFLDSCAKLLHDIDPTICPYPFGHLGDGNIHYNLILPNSYQHDLQAMQDIETKCTQTVFDLAVALGGTFSAEHGIGRVRKDALELYKQPVEMDLMRLIKQAIDPQNIMNPDVMLKM